MQKVSVQSKQPWPSTRAESTRDGKTAATSTESLVEQPLEKGRRLRMKGEDLTFAPSADALRRKETKLSPIPILQKDGKSAGGKSPLGNASPFSHKVGGKSPSGNASPGFSVSENGDRSKNPYKLETEPRTPRPVRDSLAKETPEWMKGLDASCASVRSDPDADLAQMERKVS